MWKHKSKKCLEEDCLFAMPIEQQGDRTKSGNHWAEGRPGAWMLETDSWMPYPILTGLGLSCPIGSHINGLFLNLDGAIVGNSNSNMAYSFRVDTSQQGHLL